MAGLAASMGAIDGSTPMTSLNPSVQQLLNEGTVARPNVESASPVWQCRQVRLKQRAIGYSG